MIDLVLPHGPHPRITAFSDLNLLLEFGAGSGNVVARGGVGWLGALAGARSALLEIAGFTVARILLQPEARFGIIEGLPVSRKGEG